jgi:hypothetical protein
MWEKQYILFIKGKWVPLPHTHCMEENPSYEAYSPLPVQEIADFHADEIS